jgi:membrane protein
VYYSAQIFLLGAEFTWVYAHVYGSRRGERRPRPEDSAPVEPRSPAGPSRAVRPDYSRKQSR